MSDLLFIPLDNRPCCLMFPQRLAKWKNVNLIVPEEEHLGNLNVRGNSLALISWLKQRSEPALIALDMLFWGGLVGSRQPEEAMRDYSDELRWLSSREKTVCFSTIMRVAPTQKTIEDVHWAQRLLKFSIELASRYDELQSLNRACMLGDLDLEDIPSSIWEKYWYQRCLKHKFNIELAKTWKSCSDTSILVWGYDDSQTRGINILEGDQLRSFVDDNSHLMLTTGADELAQLLLARSLAPGCVFGIEWADVYAENLVTRYEDCSLGSVVERQAKVAGAKIVAGKDVDKVLMVWTSDSWTQQESSAQFTHIEDRNRLKHFLDRAEELLKRDVQVVLADVAYANGGDISLISALEERHLLGNLSGYSAWNTAGNTLGTAISSLILLPERNSCKSIEVKRFLLERLADDYYYQSIIRPRLSDKFGGSFVSLSSEDISNCEKVIYMEIFDFIQHIIDTDIPSLKLENLDVKLPWKRLFEAKIDISIVYR